MKKKLALLLALVMIVSLVPMNVFGQTTLYRPDRQNIDLPATIVDKIRIDLADLLPEYNTGVTYENGIAGYPVRLTLTEDAVFGLQLGKSPYIFNGSSAMDGDERITYDRHDSNNLRKAISFVNYNEGVWGGSGSPTPAKSFVVDPSNGERVGEATLQEYVRTLDTTAQTQWNSTGAVTVTGSSNTATVTVSQGTVSGAGVITAGNSQSDLENTNDGLWKNNPSGADVAEWSDFVGFFGTRSKTKPSAYSAPTPYTLTYTYSVEDEDEIIIYIQLIDDLTGNFVSIPRNLDPNVLFIEMALPISLDSDDWDTELELLDMVDDDDSAFENFPRRVITDIERSMTVDVSTTASFASTGFLDVVTLNETVRNFLEAPASTSNDNWVFDDKNNNHALDAGELIQGPRTGRTRVVELKLKSDYAWLMENTRERLKFKDRHNSFHDNSGDSRTAYNIVEYFGPDDLYDDVDYNIGYEVGNRERYVNGESDNDNDTEYDVRFFFSGHGSSLPGEDPTDPNHEKNGVNSARYNDDVRADELEIYNLMVGFDDRQKFDTDVALQYRVYDIDTADLDGHDVDSEKTFKINDADDDSWIDADNVPVQRKEDVVMLDLLDDRLGAATETLDKVVSGRFDEETTPFRISEVVNGTWDTGTTVMSVGDGVEITGAHVSIYEYEFDEYDTADRTEDGTRVESTTWDANRNLGDATYWTNDGDTGNEDYDYLDIARHQDYYNNGGIRINNKQITIDPRMTALTTAGERREIEVQLELSIEAGYVWKNRNAVNPNAIDVTFSGSGASNFEATTFTVAEVHDPITVTPPTPVTAEVDWERSGYEHNIGDIIVTENAVEDLEQNKEIWLYVVGTTQTDLNLNAGLKPEVNTADSGLELYDGTQLRHQFGNFWLSGVRYNVRRMSGLSNKTALGQITFKDVTISGAMYNNAKYAVVISGDAVAENDYTVWSNEMSITNPTSDDYNTWADRNNRAGIFDGDEPYVIDAINWEDTTYSEVPDTTVAPPTEPAPEPEPAPVVVVSRSPQEFGPYSYSTDETGTYNNYMMAAASNGVGFAGISPRAFAQFIGGTLDWDAATQTATVTGLDNNGTEHVVALTLGSTSAVIDGQPVDIATYNEHPGYPAGSIAPFQPGNNRQYLPIRFLCRTFGVPFNYNDLTKSVTLY